ncbi:MAG: acyl--CoA ligase [Clostridia bacterium]|nr:acyl--CoA ligase [Clostridia bacterium]
MTSYEYYVNMLPENERDFFRYMPTINELVAFARQNFADDIALDGIAGPVSYRALCDKLAVLRGFLKAQGIEKGDHVGMQLPNSALAAELILAVMTYGAVIVPIPMTMGGEELMGNLEKLDIKLYIYGDMFAERVKAMPLPAGLTAIAASAVTDGEPTPEAANEKNTPAAIFFTGGTTGKSKGALLSHGALMRGAFNGIFGPLSALRQRYLALIPFSHVFGVVRNVLSVLYTGSLLYTLEDMRTVVAVLPKAKPTVLVLVPALADMLAGLATMRGVEALGGQLKMIIAGGAPVPEGIIFRYQKLGIIVCPGYGMTETANLVSGNGQPYEHPTSVGMPYPEQEVKLVNEEIWVRGDHLMLGYYNDPEETAHVMTPDGWLKTGDLGRIDENGLLYITGRSKNIIVLPNGENISPEELELALVRIPLIKDALVREAVIDGRTVLEAEVFPNAPVLAAMQIAEPEPAIRAAVEKLNASLPPFKAIQSLIVRKEDFPRSPSMKIIRK